METVDECFNFPKAHIRVEHSFMNACNGKENAINK